MMVGNEGKTRIPVYDMYTKAGFDPDKDLLQAPVMGPDAFNNSNFWSGDVPGTTTIGLESGGMVADWDLRTSVEGLYVAGGSAAGGAPIFGVGCHNSAHITGRYAGRRAASYVKEAREPKVDEKQLQTAKAGAYAPLSQKGIGWKELNYAIAKIMQDYCGRYKNEYTLQAGLRLLNELKESEAATARADNPHELGRLLECFSLLSVGEAILNASLVRKASSNILHFYRYDYPEVDPPEWHKLLPIHQENGKVKSRDLSVDYHLQAPYASTYEENYKLHCGL
jgi:succinate dehydrogenase/fumarate reductase flavoprotein subunit